VLEGRGLDPRDVSRVRDVTAAQWRTVAQRAPHVLDAYWDRVDDPAAVTVGKRRSQWLADLEPFRVARSAMELGCGVGRNLFVIQQRYSTMALCGMDINPDAIAYARQRIRGEFLVGNLYDPDLVLGDRTADVVFTMGVLIHLHPDRLPGLLAAMARRAQKCMVLVEQVSAHNEVVKGPASWRPERRVTGEYIQWSPNLPGMLAALGLPCSLTDVPPELQTNGARHLLVVSR
jgi:SAM-dependent methyltransferase